MIRKCSYSVSALASSSQLFLVLYSNMSPGLLHDTLQNDPIPGWTCAIIKLEQNPASNESPVLRVA